MPRSKLEGFFTEAPCQPPRIVEVDMAGAVVWEFVVPPALSKHRDPGFDVEALPSGNVLFVLPGNGIYEVNRGGRIVWRHLDPEVSHDADRLPNGNTLLVGVLQSSENSVIFEITPAGEVVWELKLKDVPVGRRPGWFYKAQRICLGE